jgi:hypothetical protein
VSIFKTPTDESTYIKTLIYGKSGTGKTVFAGSFPDPCIIDCENGWKSIKAVRGYAPPVASVKSKDDLVNAYNELAKGNHAFKTVIIDSLTDLNQYVLNDVLRRNPTRRRDSVDVPVMMDYNESGRLLSKMFYLFRDLPMHVVFIAGERAFGGSDGEELHVLPNIPPALAENVGHLVDVTLYSYCVDADDGSRHYVGRTVPTNGRIAKDRSDALPKPFMKLEWDLLATAFGISS